MSVSGVSSSLVSQLVASSSSASSSRGAGGAIAVAAKALGLSVDDVTSALTQGSSLADLAKKQGVSESDLVQALTDGAPDDLKQSSDVTAMITQMVEAAGMTGPGGAGGPGGPPPGPPPSSSSSSTGVFGDSLTSSQQSTVDSLASLLGTDSSSLLGSLRSGTSLSDLLSSSGVSYSQLAGVVQDGLLIDTSM